MKPEVNYNREKVAFVEEIEWPRGTFDEIIQKMQCYKEQYSYVMDAVVSEEWHGYEDCFYYIHGFVWETEEQQEARIKCEERKLAKWQAKEDKRIAKVQEELDAKVQRERKEYERLKAKFG